MCGGNYGQCPCLSCDAVVAVVHLLLFFTPTHSLAHISEAHINPIVSLGAALTGECHPLRAFLYIAMQAMGAACGALMAVAFTASPDPVHPSANSMLHHSRTSAFVAEAVYACILTLVTLVAQQFGRAGRGGRGESEGEGESPRPALYTMQGAPLGAWAHGFIVGAITTASVQALVCLLSLLCVCLALCCVWICVGECVECVVCFVVVTLRIVCFVAVALCLVMREWDTVFVSALMCAHCSTL